MSSGDVVIVTGATGGIGASTCRRLARDGYRVHAVDLDQARLDELVSGTEGDVRATALNLVASFDYEDLLARAIEGASSLAGLVHMAAVLRRRPDLADITEADWDIQTDTNLKAAFFLNRAVARYLVAQGTGGSIVNFASQGWWSGGYGGSVVYAATKGGVVSMTRGLARSLAPHGIRVNAVAPGFVDTAMMRQDMTGDDLAASAAQVPLGRLGSPDEIADATAFLVGPDSRYMTGTVLNVSGGQLVY